MSNNYHDTCLSNDSQAVLSGKGKNIIPPPPKEPLWKQYLEKFKDPLIIVLCVVFAFSLAVSFYEFFYVGKGKSVLIEPLGVVIALLLATGIGFIFEVKAAKEFDLLSTVKNSRPVKVLRRPGKGKKPQYIQIEKQDVVCGDIIRLENGDEVPADGILVESLNLMVDESNFTGEPFTDKSTDPSAHSDDSTYPPNQLLRGSTIIEGTCVYRVTAIGMDTEEGKGAARVQEGTQVQTPLNRQLSQLGRWISTASFIIAILTVAGRMIYYFFFDGNASNNTDVLSILEFTLGSIMLAVTLIVVAVPEGLPMSVTISLAISMRRMLKENNLVRKLHACETMGAATVICTDKTGTLTQNKMSVMDTTLIGDSRSSVIANLCVNSTAELGTDEKGNPTVLGNPTEGALLQWAEQEGEDYRQYRHDLPIVNQKPFSTVNKYMETIVDYPDGRRVRFLKGAPELLAQKCGILSPDNKTWQTAKTALDEYQQKAMRTLGFASQELTEGKESPLMFDGVFGIADPVREDVRAAIDQCMNKAHVRVIIVTGDTPGTANEIGRQIGLLAPDEAPQDMTGPLFASLSDEEAMRLVSSPDFKIISRARPDDKARLVILLQQVGEVVAVTGDGTNDAPALSKAQVGLSMGDGTSRAKEASDITIIDNSFSSINKAIMWGRSLYQNIRRFILFQMTINICACLIVLLGAFLGLDSPLNVTQMLWVNLIMDTFAAMAMSSLPPSRSVLYEHPRSPNSHIIDRHMGLQMLIVGLLFFLLLFGMWQYLWHHDLTYDEGIVSHLNMNDLKAFVAGLMDFSKIKPHIQEYELGVFFTFFVMLQFWNLFNARYFHTYRSLLTDIISVFRGKRKLGDVFSKSFVFIAICILAGQYLIVNYAGQFFHVSPLSGNDWQTLIIITCPVLLVGEIIRIARMARNGMLFN